MGVAVIMDIGAGGIENAALSASMRSRRPTIVACLPPENSASERSAISTRPVRQPASTTEEIHQGTLGLMPHLGWNIVPPSRGDLAGKVLRHA
jgi:hypothetical protein